MLITKKVTIIIQKNTKNKNYYRNLGYTIDSTTKEIYVNVIDLPRSSTIKVLVKCDICEKEKIIEYREYLLNTKKYEFYTCCIKCSRVKSKKTMLEKYGDENYSNREKFKKTCLEKYGFENVFQNENIKEEIKLTNLDKYGVEKYSQTNEFKNKVKNTCLSKYGVTHYAKTKEFKEKLSNINIKKYGVKCTIHNKEINEKIRKSNIEKYGCEIPIQNDVVKKKMTDTNIKKYGYKNPIQNIDVLNKSKKTMFLKYGVEYPMQNIELHIKQQKSGYLLKIHDETKLYYRSSYEKDFLDFCIKNNISVEHIHGFKYKFHEKNKIYFPDFYLPKYNLIIEIKSDYYFEKYLEKNLNKKQCIIDFGINFLFIINKNYTELLDFIKS